MENISLKKFINILQSNSKTIYTVTIAFFVVGFLYSLIIFKPVYKSTSKVLIKNFIEPVFISQLSTGNSISPVVRNGNPILTQIQIITSDKITQNVWDELKKKYQLKMTDEEGKKMLLNSIAVKNPVGTDIIEITASYPKPEVSKDIADAYKEQYISAVLEAAKQGIMQSKKSINRELKSAQSNLSKVRNNLQTFRQRNSTIDIEAEASGAITQKTELENRYNAILSDASLAAKTSKVIASQLGLSWSEAINSVAVGHNDTFVTLQSRLGDAKEELAGLSSKYTDSHPMVKVLKGRINGLEAELLHQVRLTIGSKMKQADIRPAATKEPPVPYLTSNVIIKDPVRTSMVDDLAKGETAYRALSAQAASIKRSINKLNGKIAQIPQKQSTLASLTQEEANWRGIVDTLKEKQVEADIREAEVTSHISIIDDANLPVNASFPTRFQLMVVFAMAGLLIGSSGTIISYLLKDHIENVQELEDTLNSPVLGVIPWLNRETYINTSGELSADNCANYYALAYEKIVTTLNLKGFHTQSKVLMFTSSKCSKERSTILKNVAIGLNRIGNTVCIIDADFRTPSLAKEFSLKMQRGKGFDNLLINMAELKRETGRYDWEEINSYIHNVSRNNHLHVIANNNNTNNPYRFIYSRELPVIINQLREKYDWVLIDTPPALAVPDAIALGGYIDGAVITSGLDCKKSRLKLLRKMFEENNINTFGVIGREVQTEEAVSANHYIKQVIDQMIPEEENAVKL